MERQRNDSIECHGSDFTQFLLSSSDHSVFSFFFRLIILSLLLLRMRSNASIGKHETMSVGEDDDVLTSQNSYKQTTDQTWGMMMNG